LEAEGTDCSQTVQVNNCRSNVLYREVLFTEITEAVRENIDSICKHKLSPYNAYYLNYNF